MRFLLLPLIIMFIACDNEKREVPKDFETVRNQLPIQEGKNVKYYYTENTKIKATLFAPHYREVLDTAKKNIVYFDSTLKITFYNENEKIESELTANRGVYNNKDGFAVATGNVVVSNIKGEKLETEKLFWHRNVDKLSTDAFVKITTKDEILYGDSLVSNTSFTNYRIYKLKGILSRGNN